MGIITFLAGVGIGSAITWQIQRRKQPHVSEWLSQQPIPTVAPDRPVSSYGTAASSDDHQTTAAGASEEPAEVALAQEASVSTAEDVPRSSAPGSVSSGVSADQTNDRLEYIKGIGHVYGQRLRAAGIQTFADLAALTPERVLEILALDEGREHMIHPQN